MFERGDVSDELYLLVSGAVYIVNGEEIIDELSPGTIFGELAMIGGDRRSATVRAATTSVIVRITRESLRPLMESDERAATQVWHTFGARRFDDLVRLDARHEHLGRRAREAWYAAGEHATLAAGETTLLAAAYPPSSSPGCSSWSTRAWRSSRGARWCSSRASRSWSARGSRCASSASRPPRSRPDVVRRCR